jgi:acetyl-CoA C-acetyltransferase
VRYERAPFAPASHGDPDMGAAADLLAEETGVGRERQDAYAAESHRRAVRAAAAGRFADENVVEADVAHDERPRSGLDEQRLARLRPAFRPEGTVTAGNSCGVNDGAAAVTLVDGTTYQRLGVPGLRVLATATAGVDPRVPGLGLVPAVRAALDRAGVALADIDVVELNEAVAGQVLACCDALGLEPARVCPDGGALALGHPWGASGAVLAVRLFSQLLRQERGELGLAGISVGGGQGVAMVVERCR